jgi:hypothetical protein
MSGVPVSKLPDDDMQAAPAALVRAGQQACELARRTGTAVVVVRDGVLVEESVDNSPQQATPPMAGSQK